MRDEDRTYSTRIEAVHRLITFPIEAGGIVTDARADYNIDAIADAILEYTGDGYRLREPYRDPDAPDRFWDVVMANIKNTPHTKAAMARTWDVTATVVDLQDALDLVADHRKRGVNPALAAAVYEAAIEAAIKRLGGL